MNMDTTPLEAGLDFFIKFDKVKLHSSCILLVSCPWEGRRYHIFSLHLEREIVCKDCPMTSTFCRALIIIIIVVIIIFVSTFFFIIVIVMVIVIDIFSTIIITNINNRLLFLKGWFHWARKFTETQGKWYQEEAVYADCRNNWCGPWRKWIYLVWRKGNYRRQFSSFWSWISEDSLLQELGSPVVPVIWLSNPPPSLPPSFCLISSAMQKGFCHCCRCSNWRASSIKRLLSNKRYPSPPPITITPKY